MVWKNVFQLAISGSVWNGINIRITSYKSNIFANIRKNQYGRVTKDGITLNLTDLEYLLGLDFSMIQKNKILNYRSCYKEINILRYTLNDEEMVNITTNTSNKSSCVSIKEDDFFRNCIPFLEYMKQLLEIKLKHLSIDEIFYVVSLVTFEKLKLNYGCYACIGVENEHTCKQSSIYNENSIP
ncbi:MAG: hypothetical protein QM535_17625, partial [Limnohabitans sp.]|nr:hypothetical protein [Limnohabitans sp.]